MAREKRIGVLVPSTNQTVEPDFYSVVPTDITIHAERMWSAYSSTPGENEADNARINDDLERAARYVATVGPDLVVYACTGGTYYRGTLEYDQEVAQLIHKFTSRPAITAVGSSVEALHHMKARRISIAGPYGLFMLRDRLKPLIESAGFKVVSVDGEPEMQQRTDFSVIGNQSTQVIKDFVLRVVRPEADTVFIPGTAWRALELVEELEQTLGKTVITVNQATVWMALRKLGWTKPIQRFGQLLRSSYHSC